MITTFSQPYPADRLFLVISSEQSLKKLIFWTQLRGYVEREMKYQQLENLESGWKWKYLVKSTVKGS